MGLEEWTIDPSTISLPFLIRAYDESDSPVWAHTERGHVLKFVRVDRVDKELCVKSELC